MTDTYFQSTAHTSYRNANYCAGSYEYDFSRNSFITVAELVDTNTGPTVGDHMIALPYQRDVEFPMELSGLLSFTSASDKRVCGGVHQHYHSGNLQISELKSVLIPEIPSSNPDAETRQSAIDLSVTKALADARRSYNNIPLLAAEATQTIAMIQKRSIQLLDLVRGRQKDSIRKYLKSRKSDRRRLLKDLSENHLEFLFGWLPLVGEIEGLCQNLSKQRQVTITGRGRQAFENEISSAPTTHHVTLLFDSVSSGVSYFTIPFNRVMTTKTRISARTSLRYVIDSGGGQTLRDWGFNPVAAAYDFIPLSFVAAFVSNVDHYLRAFDPMIGATFLTGSTGIKYDIENKGTVFGRTLLSGGFTHISSGSGSLHRKKFRFTRINYLTEPDPVFKFTNRLSPAKVATIAALAIQRKLKIVSPLLKSLPIRFRGPRPKNLPPIKYRKSAR